MPVPLRTDFDANALRAIARTTKDGPQARRLLALAAIYDGATCTEARLSGISCVGGHDGWKGAQPCRDAKSLIFLMPSWTSFWLGPIPRRPLIRTDFLTV